MGQIKIEKNVGGIEGLCVITPTVHGDDRGYFMETYSQRDMDEAGIDIVFVQDNQSCSSKGVLRGLHFQKSHPQTKLCRVIRGNVFDVAVDLRNNSSTFGQWYGIMLNDINKKQLLIPRGFAHGFLVLSDIAEYCYKCDDFYYPEDEDGIMWNDSYININWPNIIPVNHVMFDMCGYCLKDGSPIIISNKDMGFKSFKDYQSTIL